MTTELDKLRAPFAAHHISKLPKPTKAQTEAVKADFKSGIRCKLCGSWHHPDVVHLDYVGHAALTDRLLDTDIAWYWEPLAFNDVGLPAFDGTGGLWIKLTVQGVTRLGYGHAAPKPGQDPGAREKEVIGDALRNAAMRFGAALDLWHKGDLHADEESDEPKKPAPREKLEGKHSSMTALRAAIAKARKLVREAADMETLQAIGNDYAEDIAQAERYYPAFLTGEPNLEEDIGLYGEVKARKQFLTMTGPVESPMLAELLKGLDGATDLMLLQDWHDANRAFIDELSDADARKVEKAFNDREAGLIKAAEAVARTNAG